ncbi:hypothetical protein GCM10009116_21410 [Brevundimonas basaltis]|uniref:Uncharacterized protein n=1 Tax=Brevundimonas basaltis TaxID=472166 RepID=A0A7W8HXZ7_9CAUL|nr:hypothetical protein [Brevundimonas basaltis]MBB5291890.1 hypothetical protein [Brevundimonas basaltis]
MHVFALLSISIGWLKGGHPERFGALVLLLDYLVTRLGVAWSIREVDSIAATQDFVVMLSFGWLAFRTDRWWPIAATASLALCVLVRAIGMVNPELSRFAMLSAILGFWIFLYIVVLGGVAERWLAGERAVSVDRQWRRRRAVRDRSSRSEEAAPCRSSA